MSKAVLLDFRERDLQERLDYIKLLVAFSKVDNDFDPQERKFLVRLAELIDVSSADLDKLVETNVSEEEFVNAVKDFKSKDMIYSFFLDMIALTTADGIIQQNEHQLLARVCNELGMELNIMHNLLYFSLSSSYTSLSELFEPIYQTFFDTVFHWIKDLKVPIFQQTTFSINKEVDTFLKNLYQNKSAN